MIINALQRSYIQYFIGSSVYTLGECNALWGERERSRRQYSSQVSVFKPALFTEHSNADKKKRRTVADSVANVGESVAYLGVNMDVACQEGRVPRQ